MMPLFFTLPTTGVGQASPGFLFWEWLTSLQEFDRDVVG